MKNKKRLIYQLFPSYLVITLVSLFAVSWYALSFTRQFYLERTQVDLEINGRLLEKQVARLLTPLDAPAVDRFCKDAAGQTVTRVTVRPAASLQSRSRPCASSGESSRVTCVSNSRPLISKSTWVRSR